MAWRTGNISRKQTLNFSGSSRIITPAICNVTLHAYVKMTPIQQSPPGT